MPDGKVVYSDLQCPASVSQSATIIKGPTAGIGSRLPAPKKIEFTGSPDIDFIKASALMDNIKTIGRDCEWALKVENSKIAVCAQFMDKLQPNGEFQQISDHVLYLMKDERSSSQSISELRTITRHMKDIGRYKEFLLANLGVGGR